MDERVIVAPVHLIAQSRTVFREAALAALLKLSGEAGTRLVLDLSDTLKVDSSGLGALVMIQARAAEQRCEVWLRGPSEEIRFLLLMTKLDDRFRIEERGARP